MLFTVPMGRVLPPCIATDHFAAIFMTTSAARLRKPSQNHACAELFGQPPLRCKLDTAGSRHRELDHFCAFGQFDRHRFKPKRQRFLGISHSLLLTVTCGSAAGQFGEYCRPAFGSSIKFYQQPEFHYQNNNRANRSKQAGRFNCIVPPFR